MPDNKITVTAVVQQPVLADISFHKPPHPSNNISHLITTCVPYVFYEFPFSAFSFRFQSRSITFFLKSLFYSTNLITDITDAVCILCTQRKERILAVSSNHDMGQCLLPSQFVPAVMATPIAAVWPPVQITHSSQCLLPVQFVPAVLDTPIAAVWPPVQITHSSQCLLPVQFVPAVLATPMAAVAPLVLRAPWCHLLTPDNLRCRAVCMHLASWYTWLCWRSDLLLPRIYIELSPHFFAPSHPPTVF